MRDAWFTTKRREQTVRARHERLVNDATPAEIHLRAALERDDRTRKRFYFQHPMNGYYVDFVCFPAKLVIELDGQGHKTPAGRKHDYRRRKVIESGGYRIIRFWNREVLVNVQSVIDRICAIL